ncbi:MAG TPA: hypothetical protein PLO62_05690 [Candidatus Hydrogenedentes bacterium]|nr:hypothetical protein [Candidatus Hydrogenedentota bacterium]HOS01507.1 hypothetical protein [Candidatus Hydrogenedentota bacterium]
MRMTKRLAAYCLLPVFWGASFLILGCEPNGAPSQANTMASSPAASAREDKDGKPSQPTPSVPFTTQSDQEEPAGNDFVALYERQRRARQNGDVSEATDRDFDAQWKALTERMTPQLLIDGVEFLAVDVKATGEREYTFSFLFRSTKDLDTDYHLSVLAGVSSSHIDLLPEADRARQRSQWTRLLKKDEATSHWKQNECHVVSLKVSTALIPYNLRLFLHTRDPQGHWTADVGQILPLGWQWAVFDEKPFLSKIEACNDFAALYELVAASLPASKAIAQAVDERWKVLTQGVEPKPLIDGLDCLGVETQATGEQEYTFSFLFRCAKDIDVDYHLSVQGYVFPSNIARLPERDQERGYAQWTRVLRGEEATSRWKQGEHHVVRLSVPTELIPYNLRLFLHTRDQQGVWVADVGQTLALGWQWAAFDETSFLAKLEACNDYATLYAMAPAALHIPESLKKAIGAKWETLTRNATPQPMVAGLDCLGVQTKAIGDKEYAFSFLFRAATDMRVDYHMSVVGRVDPGHLRYIEPSRPGANYASWMLFLYDDPTSLWKAGEYHVAQLRVKTALIPFDISAVLQTRDAQRKWTGDHGNRLELGWQADILN